MPRSNVSVTLTPTLSVGFEADECGLSVRPDQLFELLTKGVSIQLVDVRSQQDWCRARIQGAHHLQTHMPSQAVQVFYDEDGKNPDPYGQRTELEDKGFLVLRLKGGFKAWADDGFPVQEGTAKPIVA